MTSSEDVSIEVPASDAGLPFSRPPARFVLVREWSMDSLDQLSTLRSELAAILRRGDAAPDEGLGTTPEKIVLVASELATNALEHGRPPTIVRLLDDDGLWLLEVADHDRGTVPVYAGERIPGAGGLGLHLARTLSLDVGWYSTPTTKNIWVTFPVD
ncbi:ATP-binding protein [Cellulosimicrobium cellulans]|uniref:ATP-binding protein n=1 Tax=Cellulosimicrobium cellulans TaxID=1710 RepID=UPI001C0AE3D3|nr:ATP-binding protein [Cellulosimicrobium cellulans]